MRQRNKAIPPRLRTRRRRSFVARSAREYREAASLGILQYCRTTATMPLMDRTSSIVIGCLVAAAFSGCQLQRGGSEGNTQSGPGLTTIGELPDVDVGAVLQHTKRLSSNEFEGRGPGTKGEELTVD